MSGVTVATISRSMSAPRRRARSSASSRGGQRDVGERLVVGGDSAARGSRCASRIHSSEVSTSSARSSFVTTRSGTCTPSPVIETGAPLVERDHLAAVAKVSVPRTGELVADPRDRLPAADRAARGLDLAGQRQLVARLDDPLEAHVVDPGEERELAAVLLERERGDRARLRERLDHDHARHDRPAGKVAGEEPLVAGHPLARDDAHARLELEHLVEEEERVAMRDDRLDHVAAERRLRSHRARDRRVWRGFSEADRRAQPGGASGRTARLTITATTYVPAGTRPAVPGELLHAGGQRPGDRPAATASPSGVLDLDGDVRAARRARSRSPSVSSRPSPFGVRVAVDSVSWLSVRSIANDGLSRLRDSPVLAGGGDRQRVAAVGETLGRVRERLRPRPLLLRAEERGDNGAGRVRDRRGHRRIGPRACTRSSAHRRPVAVRRDHRRRDGEPGEDRRRRDGRRRGRRRATEGARRRPGRRPAFDRPGVVAAACGRRSSTSTRRSRRGPVARATVFPAPSRTVTVQSPACESRAPKTIGPPSDPVTVGA